LPRPKPSDGAPGVSCSPQYCSCHRALACYHGSGPTCRFSISASTVFVEGSGAQPSNPLSQAADHGNSPRLLGRTRRQSVRLGRNARHAVTALSFASCRSSETDWPTVEPHVQPALCASSACGGNGLPARLLVIRPAETASSSDPLMGLRRCPSTSIRFIPETIVPGERVFVDDISPALQRIAEPMPSGSGWKMGEGV